MDTHRGLKVWYGKSVFDLPAQTIVNTVNCVGVMGAGLAKACKIRYPDMFVDYQRICRAEKLVPGVLHLWKHGDPWVLNFPTKIEWKYPSRKAWIIQGLEKFVSMYEAAGITSINFPPLGCSNGGLDFEQTVKPIMLEYLEPLPITINLCVSRL